MSTLDIGATTDFSFTDVSGTDAITFTNSVAEVTVLATFAAAQFALDGLDTSFEIAFDSVITGSNGGNVIIVNMAETDLAFSATGFVISGWVDTDDHIEINGTASAETIHDSSVNDTIEGKGGDDRIISSGGGDRLSGGAGADHITLTYDTNTDEVDFLNGDGARDTLTVIHRFGGDASVIVDGGNGRDTFGLRDETPTAVTIDITDGGGGRTIGTGLWISLASIEQLDVTLGGAGDTVTGGAYDDIISGGGGVDQLAGGDGADSLNGGNGTDGLDGGGDADNLTGGLGRDTLTGGAGSDLFILRSVFDSPTRAFADLIMDFSQGEDRISLEAIDAVAGLADDAFTFIGHQAFNNIAGELRFSRSLTQTFVSGDINGDARADFQIVLDGRIALTDLDFVL